MSLASKIMHHGLMGSTKIALKKFILRPYHNLRCRNAPIYQNPTSDELVYIEDQLASIGIKVERAALLDSEFKEFKYNFPFPSEYYGGQNGGVREEKILEHFIAYKFCNLDKFDIGDIYVDVAGAGSPWVKIIREKGYEAYAIDLSIPKESEGIDYYIQSDAKATKFGNSSVAACSLQCAYEMFNKDDDWLFLKECKRILREGGKVVISPLYMHTHHCGYSSPEFFKKGYADAGVKEYIRKDCFGIPFSRKYSPELLKERILDYVEKLGMEYNLFKVDNKTSLGQGIYCHFILVISKI